MGKRTYTYDGSEWVGLTSTTADLSNYANLTNTSVSGFRNVITNGAMNIWQRGTSSLTSSAARLYSADRMFIQSGGTGGVFTAQQSTDIPSGTSGTSLLLTCTTADTTISSGAQYWFGQIIEGQNWSQFVYGTSAAKTATASFWVKSSLTGTYSFAIRNSAANRSYVATYTINSANTWEKKVISISGDFTGTWLNDSGIGARIEFALAAGSTYTTSTLNAWTGTSAMASSTQTNWMSSSNSRTFQITNIQLEPGTIATPFEQRPIGTELALCQRYFYSIPGGELSIYNPYFNVGLSGGGQYVPTRHPVNMRVAPTLPSLTPYTYLNNSAGTALGFQVGLGSNIFGFTGSFSASNNSGSVLPSGYTIGYNQSTINVSAEL